MANNLEMHLIDGDLHVNHNGAVRVYRDAEVVENVSIYKNNESNITITGVARKPQPRESWDGFGWATAYTALCAGYKVRRGTWPTGYYWEMNKRGTIVSSKGTPQYTIPAKTMRATDWGLANGD